MPDHPIRGSDLRTPVPTLEPDDAFLAQLSSLAAAGANAPHGAAAPLATWRVGLAAASVAAVLVGVAWLAGLGPSDDPEPAPSPATTSPASEESASLTARSPLTDRAVDAAGVPLPVRDDAPTGTQGERPDRPGRGHENGNGNSQKDVRGKRYGNGPDEHAGDHPNEHATTKSDNALRHAEDKPGQRAGGRSGR